MVCPPPRTGSSSPARKKIAVVAKSCCANKHFFLLCLQLGNMTVAFDNLFGGKTPQLSTLVHEFVNKEPKKFLEDFKPEILKQVQ
jgi:hypothetical protein